MEAAGIEFKKWHRTNYDIRDFYCLLCTASVWHSWPSYDICFTPFPRQQTRN